MRGSGILVCRFHMPRPAAQVVLTEKKSNPDADADRDRDDNIDATAEQVALGTFDVVLGTEMLYDEALLAPVCQCLHQVLNPDGCAYLLQVSRDLCVRGSVCVLLRLCPLVTCFCVTFCVTCACACVCWSCVCVTCVCVCYICVSRVCLILLLV